MPKFYEAHPGIGVRLGTSLGDSELASGSYDVVIRPAARAIPSMRWTKLFAAMRTPLSVPSLKQDGREDRSVFAQTLIHSSETTDFWDEALERLGFKGADFAGHIYYDQLFFAVEAARKGQGILIAPSSLLVDEIVEGSFVPPFAEHFVVSSSDYAIGTMRRDDDAVHTFIDWLRREGEDTEKKLRGVIGLC